MDVAGMDQIEAAVGEPDRVAALAPFGDLPQRRVGAHDLVVAGDQIAAAQLLAQIAPADNCGSRPGDGNTRSDVGEVGRLDKIRSAGEPGRQRRDERVSRARYV